MTIIILRTRVFLLARVVIILGCWTKYWLHSSCWTLPKLAVNSVLQKNTANDEHEEIIRRRHLFGYHPKQKQKLKLPLTSFARSKTAFVLSSSFDQTCHNNNFTGATVSGGGRSSSSSNTIFSRDQSGKRTRGTTVRTKLSTALCVIPPDSAWDTIQRARYVARDGSYHKWPPAIRLFHPFCCKSEISDIALDVANIVEEHNLEPFEVVLDQWVIIPHIEAIENDLYAIYQTNEEHYNNINDDDNNETNEQKKIQELIANEEKIGKEKFRLRKLRERSRQFFQKRQRQQKGDEEKINSKTNEDKENREDEDQEKQKDDDEKKKISRKKKRKKKQQSDTTPRDLIEKQKQMYEEFNGPCVVCLEPNDESRQRLLNMRNIFLQYKRFQFYHKYSPTSSISSYGTSPGSPPKSEEDGATDYRPLVPIGDFPTVSSAIETARKLKGVWDPLSFNVTNLHLISKGGSSEEELSSSCTISNTDDDLISRNREYNLFHKDKRWVSQRQEEDFELRNEEQFGCDALVMLMGEEIDDEEAYEEAVNLIMQRRLSGGDCGGDGDDSCFKQNGQQQNQGQQQQQSTSSVSAEKTKSSSDHNSKIADMDKFDLWLNETKINTGVNMVDDDDTLAAMGNLKLWLDEDDDWDEGTVVVIGRTHLFTGEMRSYVCMPATSMVDGKDRMDGDSESGTERRRSAFRRSWDEGNFGSKTR